MRGGVYEIGEDIYDFGGRFIRCDSVSHRAYILNYIKIATTG
jgi:hypothetical protein